MSQPTPPPDGIIQIDIIWDGVGLYFATSPDLRGLLVAEQSIEGICKALPKAIQDLKTAATA